MVRSLRSLVISLTLVPSLAVAEGVGSAPDVRLANSAGRKLQINQIDTSGFPKVNIFALVTENEQPVSGLTDADFKVREDEVPQEPITVAAQVQPLSVVLTLDTSGSMSKAMGTAKSAANSFVDSLASNDSVGVIGFSRTVSLLAPIGSSRESAKTTVNTLVPRGDTALFDALYASLEATRGRSGRRAVVLLSDGVDDDGYGKVLSKKTISDVVALAKELNVPVFTIGLGTEIDAATLQTVAHESGGAYFAAPTPEELQALYQKLGKQLTGQYHISYNSNLPGDGSVHTIQLLQGQLRSSKGYTSPAGAVKVERVIEQPPVAQNSSVIEVIASDKPETAPVVPLNARLLVKASGAAAKKWYVAFEVPSPMAFRVGLRGVKGSGYGQVYADLLAPNKYKVERNNSNSDLKLVSLPGLTAASTAGKWYVGVEEGWTEVDMQIVTRSDVGDIGTSQDAPESDDQGSVDLPVGSALKGYSMSENDSGMDSVDRYRVKLPEAGAWQIRVRPDIASKPWVYVYNDEGVQLTYGYAANEGAGVTLKVNAESPQTIYVSVQNRTPWDLGAYNIVVGKEGVEAPPQPKREFAPNADF